MKVRELIMQLLDHDLDMEVRYWPGAEWLELRPIEVVEESKQRSDEMRVVLK